MSNAPLNHRLQNRLQDCTAVILAGGLGKRLRPIVRDRPKPLAMVNSRPFITYLLDQLVDAGLKRVVLCTGYRGSQIKNYLGQHWRSLQLIYSQESTPLGTAGALRLACDYLSSETILVMNGDSYCNVPLATLWQTHQQYPKSSTLVLTRVHNVQRFGQVRLDSQNRVVKFEEKGQNTGPGLINAGIYLLQKTDIKSIPSGQFVALETNLFIHLMTRRHFHGFLSPGPFIDIGLPTSYEKAQLLFRELCHA